MRGEAKGLIMHMYEVLTVDSVPSRFSDNNHRVIKCKSVGVLRASATPRTHEHYLLITISFIRLAAPGFIREVVFHTCR